MKCGSHQWVCIHIHSIIRTNLWQPTDESKIASETSTTTELSKTFPWGALERISIWIGSRNSKSEFITCSSRNIVIVREQHTKEIQWKKWVWCLKNITRIMLFYWVDSWFQVRLSSYYQTKNLTSNRFHNSLFY